MTQGNQSDDYLAGKAAALAGLSALTCPHSTGLRRKEWLAGYLAAKKLTPPSKKSTPKKDAE